MEGTKLSEKRVKDKYHMVYLSIESKREKIAKYSENRHRKNM